MIFEIERLKHRKRKLFFFFKVLLVQDNHLTWNLILRVIIILQFIVGHRQTISSSSFNENFTTYSLYNDSINTVVSEQLLNSQLP